MTINFGAQNSEFQTELEPFLAADGESWQGYRSDLFAQLFAYSKLAKLDIPDNWRSK